MEKNKILVTGGAGYLGSHTIIELLEGGIYEPISVDNFSNSSPEVFRLIEKITNKSVKNYTVNLCDKSQVEQIFIENPDITGIIHFAALKSVPESVEQPLRYYHNNLESLGNILHCCQKFAISHFIFSSSCSVYGNVEKLPVNEKTPLNQCESPYAETKKMGERILTDFVKTSQTQLIALRYFNPVGAHISGWNGENPINSPTNLVPVITKTAIGEIKQLTVFGDDFDTRDGSCVRDYVHVSDIAEAHILALNYLKDKRNKSNLEIINLGTGNGVTVLEAIEAFERVSGIKLNYRIGERRAGDVAAIYSDITLSHERLGWKPRYDLDDMMESAWKWQQNLSQ